MAKHVLVPYDGSAQAEQALDHALAEFEGARITVLNVIDPIEAGYTAGATAFGQAEEWYEGARKGAEDLFADAQATADEYGADLDTAIELGRPARTIVEYAEGEGVDHIVMGSHGRSGVSRILLGSVAETVVRRATAPVTVVR